MESKCLPDQVVQYVMTVPDEEFAELSVCILAHSFHTDRFRLSRQFKRQAGMTLEVFLFREKMNRAAQLLRAHLRMTVKEVSRRVGFSCCNYFIRRFKGYFGVGPGEYRTLKGRVAGKTPIGKSANNDKKIRLKRQEVENISTPKGSEDEGKPVSFYGTPSD